MLKFILKLKIKGQKMQLKFIALLLMLFSFSNNSFSQSIEWEKSLGGSQDDSGYKIKNTEDKGFIIIGSAESTNGDLNDNNGPIGTSDIWVIKLDNSGNIQWQKNYGGSENDYGRSIEQTFDGGYILTGAIESTDGDVSLNNGERDFWVVKIDSIGEIEWEKSYGGFDWDFPESIRQCADLGYIVLGITYAGSFSKLDYRIFKLDSNGNIEWSKTLGGSEDEYSTTIELTNDLGYVIAGRSKSNDKDVGENYGDYDFWIVKLEQNGKIQWEKNYGGSNGERANCIKQTSDGGFIIAGFSKSNDFEVSNNYGGSDCWIVKIDENGDIEWEKNYGGSNDDFAFSIDLAYDGGYIIAGESQSTDYDVGAHYGKGDYWLFKIDKYGNIQWEKNLGGNQYDSGSSVVAVDEHSYIISGQSRSSNGDISEHKGSFDAWIVKVNADEISTVVENFSPDIEIIPNPNFGNFKIAQTKPKGSFDVSIYDELGRLVFKNRSSINQINLNGMPSGMYWVKVSNNNLITFKKVIIF